MSAIKREINVRYLLHKLAGLVTSNWLKLLTFHGFVLYTMLFFQPAPAMALDQILVSCSGGYRASHSELNERLNFKNDNNYPLNPPVKIWNTAALHRDTEANEFYLQHSTAGTNYYRRDNTRNFHVWKGGDKSLTLSFVADQTTQITVIHNFNFYVNTFGQGRLVYGWQIIRPRKGSTGPASGLDIYSCKFSPEFLTVIKDETCCD